MIQFTKMRMNIFVIRKGEKLLDFAFDVIFQSEDLYSVIDIERMMNSLAPNHMSKLLCKDISPGPLS